jgi:hypothetical protein
MVSPFTGHIDATAQLDGRPVAISGSVDSSRLRVWDLVARTH